jgi:hypothetical protein
MPPEAAKAFSSLPGQTYELLIVVAGALLDAINTKNYKLGIGYTLLVSISDDRKSLCAGGKV